MHFSFSTLYMAVISSNVLLILLTFCFRNKKLMINTGYKLLSFFLVSTLIRFLLPIELPFTRTLYLPKRISGAIMWVRHPLFYINDFQITLWTFLLCIWLVGIVVKLIKYIRTQIKDRYSILSHSLDSTAKEPYHHLLQQICAERNRKNVFQVLTVCGINAPQLYGIFRPCILIPETLRLSEKDWYYILAHEASHHFHRDLLIKLLIRIVDIIYWWNPFCRILVHQTDTILEMRIDSKITASDQQTITDYLHCLVHIRVHAAELLSLSSAATIPFLSENDDDIVRRFDMLAAANRRRNHFLNITVLAMVLTINLLSYAFILEAYYTAPEIEKATKGASDESFYAILKEDDTYDIYYGDLLIENTDTLEYHIGIQVYTEKEFNHEAH